MTPSAELRRTHFARREPLPAGLDARAYGMAGALVRWRFSARHFRNAARDIEARVLRYKDLADLSLDAALATARSAMRHRSAGPKEVSSALAVIVEAATRESGLRPHTEQVMAALAVHRGSLIEMATGEGKTLAIGLAAALAGWTGRPCHVFTANDYLAARDADWLRPFYRRCGLRVGCVTAEMQDAERRGNYVCDITYATPREAAADFLRDRLQLGALANGQRRLLHKLEHRSATELPVQRGLFTAIVDEADNTLIDEAATPLIISQKVRNDLLVDAVRAAHSIAAPLERGRDYRVDPLYHEIEIPAATLDALATDGLPAVWSGPHRRAELLRQALAAREFFKRDRQYVVEDGEIIIVDEFTGRLMPQRMWSQGLHQAIEAKEGLDPREVSQTLARLSFQRFFRQYSRIAGLSGTVAESASELWHTYRLPVVRVPTHRPCIRHRWPDRFFATREEKSGALVREVERLHAGGRPILIGTRTIAFSEELASRLRLAGLVFNLLNATRHREEARVIARAGEPGQITIATNMAGRGTDIVPGPGVRERGGLHVIAAEPNDSQRIDRQLFGRSGRQGDPGSAQLFISMEDELLIRYAPAFLRRAAADCLARRIPGAPTLAARLVARAQRTAERTAFEQRRSVMQHDQWLEESLSFASAG